MESASPVIEVCQAYCSFYKPGKAEELACLGYSVLERLNSSLPVIPPAPENPALSGKAVQALFGLLCPRCPFFAQDCDFAEEAGGPGNSAGEEPAKPCGGFLCLGVCLDRGLIDIQEINGVI